MSILRRHANPLAAYRPGQFDDQFSRIVESMFDDFFAPYGQSPSLSRFADDTVLTPRLQMMETDQAFEIEAELPGVNKEDIKVAVDHQRVTIEAEARREPVQQQGQEQGTGQAGQVVYQERSSRKYLRSFVLPADVDDANAQARLENGVLLLKLPKKQDTQAKRLTVQ